MRDSVKSSRTIKLAAPFLALAGLFTGASLASAQDAPAQDSPAQDSPATATGMDEVALEEIVVTGSYLRRGVQGPSPTAVLSRAEFKQTPRQGLAELVALSPEFGFNEIYGDIATNSQTPAALLNLRGLGPRATLVLLNGNRIVSTAEPDRNGNFGVDVNSLVPTIMVERVEVVKDGASAIYGSDAVAGVVNFITRNNFEGVEFDVTYNRTGTGAIDQDLPGSSNTGRQYEVQIGAIMGAGNDRGHVVFAAEYMQRNGFDFLSHKKAYDFATDPDRAVTSIFGNPGSFILLEGEDYNENVPAGKAPGQLIRDPQCGSDNPDLPFGFGGIPSNLGPFNEICRLNLRFERNIVGPLSRVVAAASGYYDVSEYLQIKGDFSFAKKNIPFDESDGGFLISPSPLVPEENPGNVFGGDVLYFGRLGGHEEYNGRGWWMRSAFNMNGDVPGAENWHWDTDLVWSWNRVNAEQLDFVRERLDNALIGLGGPDCDPATGTPGVGDCHYLNPFANRILADPGDPARTPDEVFEFAQSPQLRRSTAELFTWQFLLRGDTSGAVELPGGPIGVAVGYQGRYESLRKEVDPITEANGFAFVPGDNNFFADRTTNAFFFEFVFPVVDQLELQAAGRYEEFGEANSFDPKVGVLFRPVPALALHASYGTSFRAPDLRRQFGAGDVDATGITVPGGIFGATSVEGILIPNPDLGPEEAESLTAGANWDVMSNVQVNVDYWRYDFDGIAVQESPDRIVDEFVADGGTADDPAGHIHADKLIFDPVTNELVDIFLTSINAASLTTSGIDLGANWQIDLGEMGQLNLTGRGSYTFEYKFRETVGAPVVNGNGSNNAGLFAFPHPKWNGNVSATWFIGQHTARATLRHTDGLTATEFPVDDPRQDASSHTTVDLFYSYTWDAPAFGGPTTLRVGINNVFNNIPPFQGEFILYPIVAGVYDPRGRVFTFGVNKEF